MVVLDTSGLVAVVVADDRDHGAAVAALTAAGGPFVIPAGILAEAAYMIERDAGTEALAAVLADLDSGAYTLDCGARDFPRIRELVLRYADLPLGFADAAVITCAERTKAEVLTFDRRDFDVVAGEGTFRMLETGPRRA
ncbi:MAG TPA: PIN domain-containing protein [Streptosporangiaceae bacterium]|nr:PIN domain-containing protein [Streptosporangiaceae bacterium]